MTTHRTILVVDDEPHVLQVLSVVLRGAGFRAVAAEDGALALDFMLQRGADAVIADLHMPRLSGFQLAERLYSTPMTRTVPVIIVTGQVAAPIAQLWNVATPNVCAIMVKPFSPCRLVENLHRHLKLSALPHAEAA
ncbi:MAG: response regulator [Phycisphaerae bacterium]|nr:response regulator [Phycisphaerae bacterium]